MKPFVAAMTEDAGLTDEAFVLPDDFAEVCSGWATLLVSGIWETHDLRSDPGAERIGGRSAAYVADRLASLTSEMGDRVLAIWPWEYSAAVLPRRGVIARFDYLWYPARDDLILFGFSQYRLVWLQRSGYLVHLDFEEDGGSGRLSRTAYVWQRVLRSKESDDAAT